MLIDIIYLVAHRVFGDGGRMEGDCRDVVVWMLQMRMGEIVYWKEDESLEILVESNSWVYCLVEGQPRGGWMA